MKDNPYVGPRPYERQDRHNFYGRRREARELRALMVAEREVLFYAQSGAGKTSLLNAMVIPALEEKGFHVLPMARVGSELPPEIERGAVKNVFVFSALLALADEGMAPASLLDHTLNSFLEEYYSQEEDDLASRPLVLIIDQFEEIFTTHRDRWEEARDFFLQMRQALDTLPRLGVVFAMREDHVAGMDPYVPLFPRRLRARFRMERLGPQGALEAVTKPALNAGCPFDPGVAERLVDDLRRIKAHRYGSTQETEEDSILGPFIEPVQLQVVCSRLWENLPEQEDHAIQWEEVEQYGNIDRALTDFYESALTEAMQESDVGEQALRRWFSQQLITPMETRGLAMRGPEETAGLPNAAVDVLERVHLIRADARAGARWYELAHDRLVDPIVQSNQAWEAAQETPLRTTARRWQETRDASLLFREAALKQALAHTEAHPDEVEPYEAEFLEASQQAERVRIARQRWYTIGAVVAIAVVAIMTVLTIWAVRAQGEADAERQVAEVKRVEAEEAQAEAESERQNAEAARADAEANQREAERQARLALSGQVAAQAQTVLEESPQRSLLLSLEALDVTLREGEPRVPAAENALRQALASVGSRVLIGHEESVHSAIFSPDGQWLATGSADGTVRLWKVDAPTEEVVVLRGHRGSVDAMAFSSDGRWLATGDGAGMVRLWRMDYIPGESIELAGQQGPVRVVAFSPDSSQLATGGEDGVVRLWRVDDPAAGPVVVEEEETYIKALAFAPDGRWLAVGGESGVVRLWQVEGAVRGPVVLEGHRDTVELVVFSPDGLWLATGSWDGTARLWDVSPVLGTRVGEATVSSVELEHLGTVRAMAFSPDGRWLATGAEDRLVRVWDLSMVFSERSNLPVASPRILYGHEGPVLTVAFSPDAGRLATGGQDRAVRIWPMEDPAAESTVLRGHEDTVNAVAFDPNGRWLATASDDGTAHLWEMENLTPEPAVLRSDEQKVDINAVAFSPDGLLLATGGSDLRVRLWSVDDPQAVPVVLSGYKGDVNAVAFSPDGRWLATGSLDGVARLWDVSAVVDAGETYPVAELEVLRTDAVASVFIAFSPSGDRLAVWSNDNVLRLWAVSDPAAEPVVLRGHTDIVHAAAFSPDERWLASGGFDGTVRLWHLDDLTAEPTVLTGHRDLVVAIAFSPDGRWLTTGSFDSMVLLWDLDDLAAEPVELRGYESFITAIAFSPDGRWLAVASDSRIIRLWDMGDLTKGAVGLAGHEARVGTMVFSPDGRWLATGSVDSTARLWDMSDPTADPVTLSGHNGEVKSVAFSPDGRWLATGALDSTARLWTLPLDQLIDLACRSAGRNLTYEEWQWYLRDENNEWYRKTCANIPVHPSAIDAVITQAENSILEGDAETASLAYEKALQWVDETADGRLFDLVCLSGSVHGFAELVLTSCDRAVELEPNNDEFRRSRGLARALVGDYAGAVEDFTFALDRWRQGDSVMQEPHIPELEEWVTALEAGQNPFDIETLESLR